MIQTILPINLCRRRETSLLLLTPTNTQHTKMLAWNKLPWTTHRFSPILGKVVVANVHRGVKQMTTTTTKINQVACAQHSHSPKFRQWDSKSVVVEPWLITFIYIHIAKKHSSITIRATTLKFILLLRNDISMWRFSQSYTLPRSHFLFILKMKPPHLTVLSQYYGNTCILINLSEVTWNLYDQRWTRNKVWGFLKSHKRKQVSDNVLWLSYSSVKERTAFLSQLRDPIHQTSYKNYVHPEQKTKKKNQHQNFYFYSGTQWQELFSTLVQTLLFCSKFYMPYGAQLFNIKRYKGGIQEIGSRFTCRTDKRVLEWVKTRSWKEKASKTTS